MSDHHATPAKSKGSGSSKGNNIVEGLAMGMHELVHKAGLGAFHDAPNSIEHLFGVEGGGGGGHGHEKHH